MGIDVGHKLKLVVSLITTWRSYTGWWTFYIVLHIWICIDFSLRHKVISTIQLLKMDPWISNLLTLLTKVRKVV